MFLLIDNYDSFSYNLVQAFYQLGQEPVVLKNDDSEILHLARDPQLKMVCMSAGPGHPDKAGLCLEFLSKLDPRVPFLGVCLGHQVLGRYAGAPVVIGPKIMHGKTSEIVHDGTGLFSGLPNPMKVGRYHSLVVLSEKDDINPHFTVTARGPEGEVMALQYKNRPWAGVQFHPESILTPEGMRLLANFPQSLLPKGGETLNTRDLLDTLARKENLTAEKAAAGFAALLDGRLTPSQAGAFLMGLRMKGETALELAHASRAALARAVRVDGIEGICIDVVGTGGDGRSSFNCSTATCLTLAGLGYNVIKHGNRAVSSTCGSADALEGLGISLDVKPADVPKMLAEQHFTFLFAPHFHPSFANIGPIRRELGIRTLFNLLGPMINPARPSHLFMGVAQPELVPLIAETLRHSQIHKALIACGAGNYDEITQLGSATIAVLEDGQITNLPFNPADYGFKPCDPVELSVHSKAEGIAVLKELLCGNGSEAMKQMLILNVAFSFYLLGEGTLDLCLARAKEAVVRGAGRRFVKTA